jgi:hypothetical protein
MRALLASLIAAHGAIHALGFVKALAPTRHPHLPGIGRGSGLLWLAAGILLLCGAALLLWAPRLWWVPAAVGVALSQALIVGAWGDARWGTIANIVILAPLLVTLADYRPSSLRSRYLHDVRRELEKADPSPPPVSQADQEGLPSSDVGDAATMQVRVLGLFTVADEGGPVLTQSETVTLLNDMFFLAPAALVDAPIDWEPVDEHAVRAVYANAGHNVSAVAYFDEAGDLRNFRSDDRWRMDGKHRRLLPWTTPMKTYGTMGGVRLAVEAEARWLDPGGAWTYGELVIEGIEYGVSPEDAPRR